MTPQVNNTETRLVELIQRATILKNQHTENRKHHLDDLQVATDGNDLTIFPYDCDTEKYMKDLVQAASELEYTGRMVQRWDKGSFIMALVFKPRAAAPAIKQTITLTRQYYDLVERIYQ